MNEEVISLEEIFFSLKQSWKIIALITVLTTAMAAIVSFYVIKPTYQGGVKVFIGKEGVGEGKEYSSSDITMYQNLMKTYAEIIKTNDSTKKALTSIGKDSSTSSVNRVLSNLTVSPSSDTQILSITYKSTDKAEITPILTAITNTFMSSSKELIPNGNVQIIQAVETLANPVAPNKMMNIAIGFLLGVMISVGIVFLREYLDNTVKKEEELRALLEVPVLGTIPIFDLENPEKRVGRKKKKKRKKEKNKGSESVHA